MKFGLFAAVAPIAPMNAIIFPGRHNQSHYRAATGVALRHVGVLFLVYLAPYRRYHVVARLIAVVDQTMKWLATSFKIHR